MKKEYMRNYYLNHKDLFQSYYEKNAQQRIKYQENKEQIKEKRREHYLKNKEKIKLKNQEKAKLKKAEMEKNSNSLSLNQKSED